MNKGRKRESKRSILKLRCAFSLMSAFVRRNASHELCDEVCFYHAVRSRSQTSPRQKLACNASHMECRHDEAYGG